MKVIFEKAGIYMEPYDPYHYTPDQPAENGRSYVYPHPPTEPAHPPNKKPGRVIGLIAVFLAVAVLFTALGGGLAWRYYSNARPSTPESQDLRPVPTEPSVTVDQGQGIDAGVHDKHWSLEEAAKRRDRNREALSITEIAKLGKPAVVAINTTISATDMFGRTSDYPAAGSGFIITDDGYVVTNNHVIEGANTITVVMENGNIYSAVLLGGDSRTDLAVLKIDDNDLPTVTLGDSGELQVGELAVAIGNPLGELSGTVTAGIISALNRTITLDNQQMNLLQTDAAINPGNSGGALFNSFGEVIGINTAKNIQTGIEGLGFAIPINDAKPVVESLINFGYVRGRTKIGIQINDISAEMAEYYDLVEGVFVAAVEPGSPADKAGLRNEDIIIAANGEEARSAADLLRIKEKLGPGDKMTLTVVRNDRKIRVTIILEEDKPSDIPGRRRN
ncbi:MAG: trypsin-like peptidase domain-containing protein [Saccharofermentanales bacterium]|jgi:serine protease Do|nr:PDZ domain-containing protein [Clostridiaceae bacterium]